MKPFNWNKEKNKKLKQERGISFEEAVFYIENGYILDILKHPDQEKYENQKIYIVAIDGYAYMIPFIEDNNEIFLKTIYPSRKHTKIYFKR